MAEGGSPVGGSLPATFGAKLSYMLGPLVLTLLLAVGISFAILWVVKGKIDERIDLERKEAVDREKKISDSLAETNKVLKGEQEKLVALQEKTKTLETEKEALKTALNDAVKEIQTVSKNVDATNKLLTAFKDDQKTTDQAQSKAIGENTRDIEYIKKDLKRIDALEVDVKSLKIDSFNLKTEYVSLRTDLNEVVKRGTVTETELNSLSERSRVFQLRVLAARAKEAADAAREGDLKKLLQRLTDN
jgi:septal ring factor EnvC (AmiA/AmiB activator)